MADSFDRRRFLLRTAAMLPMLHAAPILAQAGNQAHAAMTEASARFRRLRLRAHPLDDLERFYRETLKLPVSRDGRKINVTAGETAIEFSPTPGVEPGDADPPKPYYHFAFNIPHNKLDAAIRWLEPRCPLVKLGNGEFVAHFPNWDAHAAYFLDPAGNILEFIARHTLKNDAAGDFSEKDILCASEIGIVTPDVTRTADEICAAAKVDRYRGGDENFTAVGDEHGLFIVVKAGRKWFSSDRAAETFPGEVTVRGANPLERTRLPESEFAVVVEHEGE
jgi:catechol-2,3-dioxygenase